MNDFLTRRQEHRTAALDDLARPADHVRQGGGLRAGRTARDRRVEHMDAAPAGLLGPLENRSLVDGAVHRDDGIRLRMGEQAVIAVQHAALLRPTRTHTPMMRQRSARSRTVRPHGAPRGQFGNRSCRDVVHPQLFAEPQELARHGAPDVAQPDERRPLVPRSRAFMAALPVSDSSILGVGTCRGAPSANSAAAPGGNSKHAASASPTVCGCRAPSNIVPLVSQSAIASSSAAGSKLATLPVAAAPELNTVTEMRSFLSSCRSSREKCSSAALLAEYSPRWENSSWWRNYRGRRATVPRCSHRRRLPQVRKSPPGS